MTDAHRTTGEPRGPGEFLVLSATRPDVSWVVTWQSARLFHCGCPRFAQAGRCRHTAAVFEAIRDEWAQHRATGALRHQRERTTA